MAMSNKKNVNILPINTVAAEERSCAPTSYTCPLLKSFTLMLEEPKESRKHNARVILVHDVSVNKNQNTKRNMGTTFVNLAYK